MRIKNHFHINGLLGIDTWPHFETEAWGKSVKTVKTKTVTQERCTVQ